ncbi:MAG: ABC transporter ATP-binding protein [Xanthobacteraceae bacterium]|nr:ABC transporter ATP-binding protein [Xanthobacteraceae bacterium]
MPLLEIKDLTAGYGDVDVLHGVSLTVEEGEIVSLVGANGAGKTTLLRAISGVVRSHGYVGFLGSTISGLPSHDIVSRGIAHVPEGRELFSDMTVLENLLIGAPRGLPRHEVARRLDDIWSLFPRLAARRDQYAGTLSGGEQQMAAVGRGLMLHPKLLMLDEPSLGLSPAMVTHIFDAITSANRGGMAVLVVEQNVVESLRRSHRGYVLETGSMVAEGEATALLENERLRSAFLGALSHVPAASA